MLWTLVAISRSSNMTTLPWWSAGSNDKWSGSKLHGIVVVINSESDGLTRKQWGPLTLLLLWCQWWQMHCSHWRHQKYGMSRLCGYESRAQVAKYYLMPTNIGGETLLKRQWHWLCMQCKGMQKEVPYLGTGSMAPARLPTISATVTLYAWKIFWISFYIPAKKAHK